MTAVDRVAADHAGAGPFGYRKLVLHWLGRAPAQSPILVSGVSSQNFTTWSVRGRASAPF
jgi:hypothetical protein